MSHQERSHLVTLVTWCVWRVSSQNASIQEKSVEFNFCTDLQNLSESVYNPALINLFNKFYKICIYKNSIIYKIKISIVGSLVRPKVVRSVHYCDVTKTVLERAYSDLTSLEAFPHSAIYPTTVIIPAI